MGEQREALAKFMGLKDDAREKAVQNAMRALSAARERIATANARHLSKLLRPTTVNGEKL